MGRGTTSPGRSSGWDERPGPSHSWADPIGHYCENLLRTDDGLEPLVVPTGAPTRVILTVRTEASAEQTAFFDPDPSITADEADALFQLVEQSLNAGGIDALTLSGSSPAPATHGLYSDLIALAKARGVPVFLDTYGPSLAAIWGFWPTAIQINRREAAAFLRKSDGDRSGCRRLAPGLGPAWREHRSRHRRTRARVDLVSRQALSSHSARDHARQPDRLGRLGPRGARRRLAERARTRTAAPPCHRLRSEPTHSSGTLGRSTRPRSPAGPAKS